VEPADPLNRSTEKKEGIQKKEGGFTGNLMMTTELIANRTDLA
jgi:hypothetical protein